MKIYIVNCQGGEKLTCPTNPKIYKALQDRYVQSILKLLKKNEKLTTKNIAEALNKPRNTIGYHLSLLEHHNILDSTYQLFPIGNPKARISKVYSINDGVLKEIIECSKKSLDTLLT